MEPTYTRSLRQNRIITLFLSLYLLVTFVKAQDCSALNPCASGCCSKYGYCGTGDDFCSTENCVDTCDFKLGCDADNPCAEGSCCSKFGYCGLGPDYCAADLCVAGCDSKSYCDPGYGSEWSEISECPLNVCCSKYGYCGVTEEFCGNKTVTRPSCSTSGAFGRVVGYYEGWSTRRSCDQFYPEQIPLGIYTHINFAFASIDPYTFEVLPADSEDVGLYSRLTYLKQQDPDLKVFIAIGGWSFNDPGATVHTFSKLAASDVHQSTFFTSLISFMSTYDFDGIDIDWEYPVATDRGGKKEDYANYPSFVANLKSALKSSGRDGVSVTLPASYWYLQNFDIVKLAKSVDWFNVMTYDLHGTWDKGNKWVGNFLNAHTNLTEITDALDLLWRNDITPGKVNLGLGFYGRSFTATSSSCLQPGCTFESGGTAAPCSNSVGTLMNVEIKEIMDKQNLTPTLYKDAAVKVLTWDSDQWVAFDDADTLKLKTDFAKGQCLGGVMVWAVTHDTSDGLYSNALASLSGRKPSLQKKATGSGDDSADTVTTTEHNQCKWTNCQEDCPSGFTWMTRNDGDARENESMTDITGCDGNGFHKFCCPVASTLPTCGWYGFRNGKCTGTCPDGTVEVGSLSKYCNNGNYEAACCTTGSDSMALYDSCSWAAAPGCDGGVCPDDQSTKVALSSTGSGGAVCNVRSFDGNTFSVQQRDYCCAQDSRDKMWDTCYWYDSYGPKSSGRTDDFCLSGCPDNLVRVAMDGQAYDTCSAGGTKSMCCADTYTTTTTTENPILTDYRQGLIDFLNDPTCSASDSVSKRGTSSNISESLMDSYQSSVSKIGRRDAKTPASKVDSLLLVLMVAQKATDLWVAERDLWNDFVQTDYPNLSVAKINAYVPTTEVYKKEGPLVTAQQIVCNMDDWNTAMGLSSTSSLQCYPANLTSVDTDLLDDPDDLSSTTTMPADYTSSPSQKRSISSYLYNLILPRSLQLLGERDGEGAPRYFKVSLGRDSNGNERYFYLVSLKYPNQDNGNNLESATGNLQRFTFARENDCGSAEITSDADINDADWVTEHILELQTIARFLEFAVLGTIPAIRTRNRPPVTIVPQYTTTTTLIDYEVVAEFFTRNYAEWDLGGLTGDPADSVMAALGSTANPDHLVNADTVLNGYKTRLWQGIAPVGIDNWRTGGYSNTDDAGAELALDALRATLGALNYLNDATIVQNLRATFDDVTAVLVQFQTAYNTVPRDSRPTDDIDLITLWREYMEQFTRRIFTFGQTWFNDRVATLRETWTDILNNDTNEENRNRANDFLADLEKLVLDNKNLAYVGDFAPTESADDDS